MRVGVDRHTGEVLTGWDHCQQSISLILTTAVGSVSMLREFGSEAPALQDRPMSSLEIARHYMAAAEALRRWEPGYRLTRIATVAANAAGAIAFSLSGVFFPNGHLGDFSRPEAKNFVVTL